MMHFGKYFKTENDHLTDNKFSFRLMAGCVISSVENDHLTDSKFSFRLMAGCVISSVARNPPQASRTK